MINECNPEQLFDFQPESESNFCRFCGTDITDDQFECEKCLRNIELARPEEEADKTYEERQQKIYWQIRLGDFLKFRLLEAWWWGYAFEFLTGDLPARLLKRMRR